MRLSKSIIIDHIDTSSRNIAKSEGIPISLSDDFKVFCVHKFDGALLKDHKTIKTRRMNTKNEQMFLMNAASVNWAKALGQTDDINLLVSNCSKLFINHRETGNSSKKCESRTSTAPGSILIFGHLISLGTS